MFRFLLHFHGPAAYVGVLFVLICCGLGVPLPEDVPLIIGGYLAARGGSLPAMIVTGLIGILIGDSIIHRAGHTYGERLLETRLGKHIPGEKVQRTIHLFEKHGAKFIMAARFVPGLRAVTYFVAGTTGVPYWKFILFDGLAACVSAPAWVAMGWWAGKNHMLPRAWRWAAEANTWIFVTLGALIAIWALIGHLRRRARRRRGEPIDTPIPKLRAVGGRAARRIS